MEQEERHYTGEEDTNIARNFFNSPIGEMPTFNDLAEDRTISDVQKRFFNVLSKKILTERVRQNCKHDITKVPEPVQYTVLEDYALVNGQRIMGTSSPAKIVEMMEPMLNISRSIPELKNRLFQLENKGMLNYNAQLNRFKEYKNEIIEKYKDTELPEIEISEEDLKEYFIDPEDAKPSLNIGEVISQISDKAQEFFGNSDLACLMGRTGPLMISKVITKVGRQSQFVEVDIDLSPMKTNTISRMHAIIRLCKDFNFYISCRGSNLIINGKILMRDETALLNHGDILDIGGCLFVFIERLEFMTKIRGMRDA